MKKNNRNKSITAIIILLIAVIMTANNDLFAKPALLKGIENVSLLKTLVSVKGKIIDKINNQPIGTKINIFNESGKKIGICKSNSEDGSYFLTGLKPASLYLLSVETPDENYKTIEFKTPDVNIYTEIVRDILIDNDKNKIEILSKK